MLRIDWTRVDANRFEELCGDTIRACLPLGRRGTYVATSMKYRSDLQCDGLIENGGFEDLGLESPVFISCKTTDPQEAAGRASTAIKRAFLSGLDRLVLGRPKSVILFSNHDLTPLAQDEIRKRISGRFQISFQGRSALEQRFREHPHLLWKYFKWSPLLESFHSSDVAGLKEALLPDELAQLVPMERLRHPALKDFPTGRRALVRVVGKPGSGKSTALWQLLANQPDSEIILVRSLDSQQTWAHLEELLFQGDSKFTLVVDDMQELLAAQQGIGILPAICELSRRSKCVTNILVAYRSTSRRQVEQFVSPRQWSTWGFEEISLDGPKREFIRDLVVLACDTLEIRIERNLCERFVDAIADWENTPACALSALLPYRGTQLASGVFPVQLRDRISAWNAAFAALVRAGRNSEVQLLRSVSALRECGLRKVPVRAVEEVFEKVSGAQFGEFEQALTNLQEEGWLRALEGFVSAHDVQIAAEVVGLIGHEEISPWLQRFQFLLINNELTSLVEHRRDALLSLAGLYRLHGKLEVTEEICTRLLESLPEDARALCTRGLCRIHLGQSDEGISDLRAATVNAPDDRGLVEHLFVNLLRAGQKESASQVLDEFVSRCPSSPEALGFASFAYSLANEREKSLRCAEKLWELERDAWSAATLAEALARSGKSAEGLELLNSALGQWPENARLQGTASDVYYKAGEKTKALEFAKKAVNLAPNDPSNHAAHAWLLIEHHQFREAERIVKTARTLFPDFPDLLAIEGMLLVAIGMDLDKAVHYLNVALRYPERLGTSLGENTLLSLADALTQLGRDQEGDDTFDLARKHGVPESFCLIRKASALKRAHRLDESIAILEQAIGHHDVDKVAWMDLGEAHAELGRHKEAAQVYRKALEQHPESTEIISRVLIELIHLGEYKSALPVARKLLRLTPQSADAHRNIGLCLRYLGLHKRALRFLDQAVLLDPKLYVAIYNKAESLLALDSWGEALQAFDLSLSSGQIEESHFTRMNRGLCLAKLGRTEEALEEFEAAIQLGGASAALFHNYAYALAERQHHTRAVEFYDKATDLKPDFREAWLAKARSLLALGNYDSAAEALERANPFGTPDDMPKDMVLVRRKGKISFLGKGGFMSNLVEAHTIADQLADLAPQSARVLLISAKLAYSSGNMPDVLTLCDRILAIDPSKSEALLWRARAENRMARIAPGHTEELHTKALESLEIASTGDSWQAEIKLQMVVSLAGLDRRAECLREFELAKGMDCESADDWTMAGFSLLRIGADAEALFAFNRALAVNPEKLDALRGKAETLLDSGQVVSAKLLLDECLRLAQADSRLLCRRGDLSRLSGDLNEAHKFYARALKWDEKLVEAHVGFAMTSPVERESKEHFIRALELDDGNRTALRELGFIELNEGHNEIALGYLRKAVGLSPDDARARFGLAFALATAGERDQARIEYETCISLNDNPYYHHQYARLLEELGDGEGAQRERKRAVESVGDRKESHEAILSLLFKSGPAESVRLHLEKLLELDPANCENHRVYANFCSATEHHEEAESHYREAIRLSATSAQCHADFACHLARLRKSHEAVAHFEQARELAKELGAESLGVLIQLLNLALDLGNTVLIARALEDALECAKQANLKIYEDIVQRTLEIEDSLEARAIEDGAPERQRAEDLCFSGVLAHVRGDRSIARAKFRKACAVGDENRVPEAVSNWCNLLAQAIFEKVEKVSEEEVREATDALTVAIRHATLTAEKEEFERILCKLSQAKGTN